MSLAESVRDIDLSHSVVSTVGNDQYNTTNIYQAKDTTLTALKPALRSGYHVPRCMKGTRESVFKEIYSWLNGPDTDSTPNVMWINGSPGAGKSAIASTLVLQLTKLRRLGAFFFFKRGDAVLGDPCALWRTVAYDLAHYNSSMKASIVEFLDGPGFRDADILLHFECMIEDILRTHREALSKAPPIIVIDALDECGLDDARSPQRQTLLDTLNCWSSLPRSFKLIVTSRDDRVPSSFYDSLLCRKITLETGDSVSTETQNDICAFFTQRFNNIRPTLGMRPTWPGEHSIDLLTRRAAGLFIWAQTVISFMAERQGDPITKLKLVLAGDLGGQNEIIDTLYRQILDFSFKGWGDASLELFKAVVGAIIVAKTPLRSADLRRFLGRQDRKNEWQFNVILHNLSSVIEFDDTIRLKHLSFAEFLSDINRCGRPRLVIDRSEQHRNMTLACLKIMKAELRFNICGLESSHVRNDDVKDLSQRVKKNISTPLSYSCRFWATHLCGTTFDEATSIALLEELQDFFDNRLLYWLEVMSLIKEIPASSIAILIAARRIDAFDAKLASFARDANRFIANFRTPISESTPHIYLSALPFSPPKSLISKQFISQFPATLSVVTGKDDPWPALVNVLSGHTDWVTSIAYSLDGKRVVSGSSDKTLRVWDVETGEVIAGPLKGHTLGINSVAYLPDGRRVVSGSADKSLRIWDIETGQTLLGPLIGHAEQVHSIACSSDGKWIVSGSDDNTLRAWDAETGQPVSGPLQGHLGKVLSVAYSPKKAEFVSGSSDTTLRVWDINTGKTLVGPMKGHTDSVASVAYSPDGTQIVSGSRDRTLIVWDAKTGRVAAGPFTRHTDWVMSVAFSPDGNHIASGSADNTLCIWDIKTRQRIAGPFWDHTEWVNAVAYSPDGRRVVSGSADKTIRVWDVEISQVPFERHTDVVLSVAFSPNGQQAISGSSDNALCIWDVESGHVTTTHIKGKVLSAAYSLDGKRVVSGSSDGTLCVWDVETSKIVAGPFTRHTDWVTSVGFSPDRKWVVSSSDDKTIYIWEVDTGEVVAGPLVGHREPVTSVAFLPDGKRIVSGSHDRTLYIWDINTGRIAARPFQGHTGKVLSIACSRDGKQVVSGSADKTLCIWEVASGRVVTGPMTGHKERVLSVAFSPDGERVVSGSEDRTVRVWDAKTGQVVSGPLRGHTYGVTSVAYSPDGRRVLSGSTDRTLRVWHVESGLPVTLDTISGPNFFSTCSHHDSNGWTTLANEKSDGSGQTLIFWVPPHARQGLCDAESLLVLGVRRTQLDLSRFVHGTSWTQCHVNPSPSFPALTLKSIDTKNTSSTAIETVKKPR